MPRKRLFPPQDPNTGCRLQSKGRDDHSVLTVNGRITLWRRRYSSPGTGSVTPMDALLDAAEATVTVGVRELVVLRPPPDDDPTGSTDWSSIDFPSV